MLTHRQTVILERARLNGRVSVDALAEALSVSVQTIRKDINELCDLNFLSRVHGGAVIASGVDLSTQNMPVIPSYWVADAMAAYRLNKNVNLRLNLYNLFDKEYIESLNNSGARARLGTPRSAMFTTELSF